MAIVQTHTDQHIPAELKTLQRRLIRSERTARWLKFEGNGISDECVGFPELVTTLLTGRDLLAEEFIGSTAKWQCIRRDVLRAKAQHGFHTLALGLVKVQWMDHRQIKLESPLFVLDLQLEPVRFFGAKSRLIPSESLRINPLIHAWLLRETEVEIPSTFDLMAGLEKAVEELVALLPDISMVENPDTVSIRNWKVVQNVAVLDRFDDPGIALYNAFDHIDAHEWKRIAETTTEQKKLSENDVFQVFPVLPFDGSQARAIMAASSGEQFLLQGPPGTGKSQTITNIVANAVAQGKQVAVVSTKQAALDAVHHRLKEVGLGCMVLRCNDIKSEMPDIVRQWKETVLEFDDEDSPDLQQIQASRKTAESKMAGQLLVLDQRQKSLKAELDTLNEMLEKRKTISLQFPVAGPIAGIPDYSVWKELHPMVELIREASTEAGIQCPSEISAFFLNSFVLSQSEKLPELIDGLERDMRLLEGLIAQSSDLTLAEVGMALQEFNLKVKLASKGIKYNARFAADVIRAESKYRSKSSKLRHSVTQLGGTLPELTLEEAKAALQQLAEKPGWWKRRGQSHRKLKLAIQHVNSVTSVNLGAQRILELHLQALEYQEDVDEALQKLETLCNGCGVEEIVAIVKAMEAVNHAPDLNLKPHWPDVFDRWRHQLNLILREVGLLTIHQIANRILTLQRDIKIVLRTAPALSRMYHNATPLFDFLRRFPGDWAAAEATVLDYTLQQKLALAGPAGQISGNSLEVITAQMQQAMAAWLKTNAQYIKARQQQKWQIQTRMVAMSSGTLKPDMRAKRRKLVFAHRLLRKAMQRKQRFMSLRELTTQGMLPVIESLSPITICTPESLVEAFFGLRTFDLIVFDEAGIIPLESAVPCLTMTSQAVVSGDPMQMTPSAYFVSKIEDDNLPDTLLDWFAEIRTVRALNWHYRSHYEKLIAWSNKHFYSGKLNTVPAADEATVSPVRVHQVKGVYNEGCNEVEAQAVVSHVRRMMVQEGKSSILIVALSITQAEQIESWLSQMAADDPYFDLLLEQAVSANDGLMIRTLEHLQGDEREHVIISIGYGPGENGKLRLLMGPIVREGGERRLNVLFSRARLSMDVFCSFSPADLPGSDNPGIHHLRNFLVRNIGENVESVGDKKSDTIILKDAMVFDDFSALSYVFVLLPLLKSRGWKVQQQTLPDLLIA